MRRLIAAILAPFAVTAVLAGCSSTSSATASANESVKVSGAKGKEPVVTIPARKASGDLVTKTLVTGHGTKLTAADSYMANFSVYIWHGTTNNLLISSFKSMPQVLPVTMGLKGLQQALNGQRVGSRILAVLPPKDAYGPQGNPQLHLKGTDTMVWVIDLLKAFPPNASATGKQLSNGGGALPQVFAAPGATPQIKIPKTAPPAKLIIKTLIQGTGAPVQAGQAIVVRYVGSIWRTGQVFNSNWPTATSPNTPPSVFTLGQLIPAWNTGLVGVPVGSRVLLVVPSAEGYGSKGSPQAGIKGTDTLVFVVDILATA
jgi:FKBP-type peptidyl-prolyl cis-trans isomerase